MRIFNTTGPVRPHEHYCLPLLGHFELADVLFLIDQGKYFVLHAPRQDSLTRTNDFPFSDRGRP